MTTVATSTVYMIGFFIISRGFSFTNDCFRLSITCSFGNKEADFIFFISSLIQNYKLKCSAIVLKACTGKKDRAATMKITTNVIIPKVSVSVFSVPALSGMNFF